MDIMEYNDIGEDYADMDFYIHIGIKYYKVLN